MDDSGVLPAGLVGAHRSLSIAVLNGGLPPLLASECSVPLMRRVRIAAMRH